MSCRRGSYYGGSTVHIPGRNAGGGEEGPPRALERAKVQTKVENVARLATENRQQELLEAVAALEREFENLVRELYMAWYVSNIPTPVHLSNFCWNEQSDSLFHRILHLHKNLERYGNAESKRRNLELLKDVGSLESSIRAGRKKMGSGELFEIPQARQIHRELEHGNRLR